MTVRDAKTHKMVKLVEVGQTSSNVCFTPDGKRAYVAVTGTNAVAAIDLASLTVAAQSQVGKQPQGLILMAVS